MLKRNASPDQEGNPALLVHSVGKRGRGRREGVLWKLVSGKYIDIRGTDGMECSVDLPKILMAVSSVTFHFFRHIIEWLQMIERGHWLIGQEKVGSER